MFSSVKKYMYKIYIYISFIMPTRKIRNTNDKKRKTRRIRGGDNTPDNEIPCGVNDRGELTKCPPNYRCETISGKKICKPSVQINLTHNGESISLSVPWKRHERWLQSQNILNNNISLIKEIRSNKLMNKKRLTDENKRLLEQIDNPEQKKVMQGANNLDELIIQKILLMDSLKQQQSPSETKEEEETEEVEEAE